MARDPLLNEREILCATASGDQQAFKILYDHYRPLVYTFSLKYLKSSVQAEEAVQEVFLKLWRLGEQLAGINNLEGYILSMCRNFSLDVLRRSKFEALYYEEVPANDINDYCNSTEESILLKDTRKVLDEAIALLPPQQKLVYTRCQIDGRKQNEVAKELQLSPETVKRHMKLALKFIRSYVHSKTDVTVLLIILQLI